jgi:HSP20 family protein
MRLPFFGDQFFDDMDRMMQEMIREATESAPRDMVRERRLPDGSTIREIGPIVYGYSMKIGPDGKPILREFGNVRPAHRVGPGQPKVELAEKREPLVDVIDDGENVKVLAELPGVEKHDIKLSCDGHSLTVAVEAAGRKYYKQEPLGSEVDPDSAKATYKNGVLEVTLRKVRPAHRGKPVTIE